LDVDPFELAALLIVEPSELAALLIVELSELAALLIEELGTLLMAEPSVLDTLLIGGVARTVRDGALVSLPVATLPAGSGRDSSACCLRSELTGARL
jgi:hypothetical protein